jgi:O-antigen/teichoic acid export membrane protein
MQFLFTKTINKIIDFRFMSLKTILSSTLFKNSLVYIITDGINKAIPFLLLPFLTYYLTTDDYGIITNFNVLVQILSVFGSAAAGALPVMYYKLDNERYKVYLSNVILLNSVFVFVMLFILLIFNNLIATTLKLTYEFQLIALSVVWFSSLININLIIWRCEEKALIFGKYQVSQSILNVLFTLLLVIVLLLSWQGRVYGYFASMLIFGFISLYILYKRKFILFKISKEYIRHNLLFAIPLIPHALSFWFKSGADKLLLTNVIGLSENGLYSAAMTFGAIVTMVLISFNNAFAPYLYKKLNRFDKNEGSLSEKKQLTKLTYLIIALTLGLVIVAYFISILVIKYLYNITYIDSIKFLPYVMLSQFFYGGYLMFVCYCHHTFKTKILGIITFSLSVTQVILSYLLIKWIGSVGTAIASAIISFFTFIFVAGYAMKVYKLPWFFILKNEKI